MNALEFSHAKNTMSYTDSGFDKRVRNLLAALESAAPPPPPPEPPADSFIRLRANDLVGADMSPVSTWPDTSGNSNDATTLGIDPVLLSDSGVNGKKGVLFDSASPNALQFPSSLTWPDGQNWFVFVGVPLATGNLLNFGSAEPWTLTYGTFTDAFGIFAGEFEASDAVFPVGAGVECDVVAHSGGGAALPTWARNGVVIGGTGALVAGVRDPSTINLLGAFTGPAFFGNAIFCELIVYQRLPTAQDRLDLIAYLADFYAL